MHEIDVLDQRAPQGPGNGVPSPVGNQPPSDLLLDLLTELVDPRLDLLAEQALVEFAHVAVADQGLAAVAPPSSARSSRRSVRYR